MTISRKEIVAAVEAVQGEVARWEQSSDAALFVSYRGQKTKAISEGIETSALSLFQLCDTMDVEPSAQELVLAIDDFDDALHEWSEGLKYSPANTSPGGTVDVWMAWSKVVAAMKPRAKKLPEPIDQLVAQKVSPANIAKIYGWYDGSGIPDIRKVQEEIERPGSHFKVDEFVFPQEQKRFAQLAENWQLRGEAFAKQQALQAATKPKMAPESIEQLLDQRVSVEQIAKMKKCSTEEVEAIRDQIGFGPRHSPVIHADPRVRQMERERQQEDDAEEQRRMTSVNTYPELGSVEERVAALINDGHSNRDIAALLAPAYPGLTMVKVSKMRKVILVGSDV